jgi:hypothetical protein
MSVPPSPIIERIEWFEQRIAAWTAAPANVGLTAAQCTALAGFITKARDAYEAAKAARNAAKNATLGQTAAMRTLSDTGSDAIRYIRAYAQSQTSQAARDAVYAAASVPPLNPPSPAGPPETPWDLVGDPNADGTVTLRWKGTTANQTFFSIWRRTGNNTTWQQIGAVATKSYVDISVPGGTPSVRYYVRAQRHNQISPASDEAIVNFGVSQAA